MKHIINALVAVLVTTGAVSAQSMLRVSLSDRTPITVSLDGRFFNKRGESVTVGDLPQGRHYLKVFTIEQDRRGRAREQMIYEGAVKTYRGQRTIFTIDAFAGTTSVSEEDMNQSMPAAPIDEHRSYDDQGYNRTQDQGNYNNGDNPPPARVENNGPVASPVTIDDGESNKPVVKETKLEKLKKKAAAKNTDTEKFEAVKESLKKDNLNTTQVCTIMDWFSFESAKVEFAKWGYPKTVDKQNYDKVRGKLTYKSYTEDLDKFIREQK